MTPRRAAKSLTAHLPCDPGRNQLVSSATTVAQKDEKHNQNLSSQRSFQLESLNITQGLNVLHLLVSPWRRPRKLTFSASIKPDFPVGPLTAAVITSGAETQY